jgi:hypothetical protein
MTTAAQRRSQDALKRLHDMGIKPGDTLKTICVHVSRSGMMRNIRIFSPDMRDISALAAAALGWTEGKHGGVRVDGCGMDMGFHLVYSLSYRMFPDGFNCVGKIEEPGSHWTKWCPANDHSNGERSYAKTIRHEDGGYALRHAWL